MQSIRNKLIAGGFSEEVFTMMLSKFKIPSPAKGTLRRYQEVWSKFSAYCTERKRGREEVSPTDIANFVAWRFNQGASGSAINAIISALDMTRRFLVEGAPPLAEDPVIKELRKTAKQKRPPPRNKKPKEYFDPGVICRMLAAEKLDVELPNLQLRQKVEILMVLDAAARGVDLIRVSEDYMTWEESKVTVYAFWTKEQQEQSWTPFVFRCSCAALKNACTFCSMLTYKSRPKIAQRRRNAPTIEIVTDKGVLKAKPFFISHRSKAARVSLETIRKDLTIIMRRAVLEEHWTPHDLRGAVASKLFNLQAGRDRVLSLGRWKSKGPSLIITSRGVSS